MADKDFEEFSDNLDELPQHFRATDKTYQWVFFWKKREGKVCCWCYARFETFLKSQGNAPRRNWKVSPFFVPFNQSSEIDLILGKSSIFVFALAGQSLLRQKKFSIQKWPCNNHKKKQPRHDLIYRLVHAITPLEENKSFLEKVQSAGKLCGVEELWNRQKRSPSPASASLTSEVNREDCEETDSDSDDLLSSLQTSSHIKWSEKSKAKHQQPKSRLMPSFTKKSLEFHNCPEAFPKQRPKGMSPMHFSWGEKAT